MPTSTDTRHTSHGARTRHAKACEGHHLATIQALVLLSVLELGVDSGAGAGVAFGRSTLSDCPRLDNALDPSCVVPGAR
jgi:hypothetical protein